MKRNKNEYFGQITVAFLSSRIQETEAKFLNAAKAALKNFASVSCILLLMKATVIWPKYSFLFRFISICLSDAHLQAGQHSRQS